MMLPYRIGYATSPRVAKYGIATLSYVQTRWHSGVIPPTRNIGGNTQADATAPTTTTKVMPPKAARSSTPLSVMPLNMLLRSFFIATISSNKYLLMPSLKLLSFLAKPNRSYLFNVDRNPVLHALLKRTLYNQFCAGETAQETRNCVKQLTDLGFKGVILTYAKEILFDHRAQAAEVHANSAEAANASSAQHPLIEAWRIGTLGTVDLIREGDILAIKTTGAGPAVADAFHNGELPPQQMMEALEDIATTCKNRGIKIIVDAESQYFQKGIDKTALEIMRKFNRKSDVVIYNTYQAYLKGTPKVVEQHMTEAEKDGFTLGLKLVRGAYILSEDRSLIHDTKEDTDKAYNDIVHGTLQQKLFQFGTSKPFPATNLLLASHNKESVMSAQKLHAQRERDGLPTVPICFAQLHGMSDEIGFSLLNEQEADGKTPDVFKCSTWGSMGECVGYLLRRAVENRDAVLRTKDEFNALKKEVRRRIGLEG